MTIEISVKSSKWKLFCIYKPPRDTEKNTSVIFCLKCAKDSLPTAVFVYFSVIWTVTYVTAMYYLMCLTCLVSLIWCFKRDTPTLVDVFLTNRPKCLSGVINVDIRTSDFHNYSRVITRAFAPRQIRRKITYRTWRTSKRMLVVLIAIAFPFMSQIFLTT